MKTKKSTRLFFLAIGLFCLSIIFTMVSNAAKNMAPSAPSNPNLAQCQAADKVFIKQYNNPQFADEPWLNTTRSALSDLSICQVFLESQSGDPKYAEAAQWLKDGITAYNDVLSDQYQDAALTKIQEVHYAFSIFEPDLRILVAKY